MARPLYNVINDYVQERTPEQNLLSAILLRSIRDIYETGRARETALAWFELWENTMPNGVSYKDICDEGIVDHKLKRLIRNAISYGSQQLDVAYRSRCDRR
jgi:hypothetical protein